MDTVGSESVISYFGHELEAPLDARRRFFVQDPRFVRRDNGGIDEAQEHGAAHGADAVLGKTLTHHLPGEEERGGGRKAQISEECARVCV